MLDRRTLMIGGAAAAAGGLAGVGRAAAAALTRAIPASGELLPVIGMGTSRTFDVGGDAGAREGLAQVLRAFFAGGGTLIDSSPMYGTAELVTGDLLGAIRPEAMFLATKVWTDGEEAGAAQVEESANRLGVARLDLEQVHNLRDWRTHLRTLRSLKAEGRLRYVGITTSRAAQYADFEAVMRSDALDFVQLNYSVGEREAERVLLPLARDRGMAVLVNRPFMRGALFRRVAGRPIPAWAAEIDCASWAQLLLKFVVSSPAVTCVIPATADVGHMRDNMQAGFGRLPDAGMRERIAAEFA